MNPSRKGLAVSAIHTAQELAAALSLTNQYFQNDPDFDRSKHLFTVAITECLKEAAEHLYQARKGTE